MACPRDVQLARLWSSTVHEARPERRQIANCRMDNLAFCARCRHPQPPNILEMTRAIISLSSLGWLSIRWLAGEHERDIVAQSIRHGRNARCSEADGQPPPHAAAP